MSSGFSGSPDFFNSGGIAGRSFSMNPSQNILRSLDFTGKRSLPDFQQENTSPYLRSVKPRFYQHTSPISTLSPVDFISPEIQQLRPYTYTYPYAYPIREVTVESECESQKKMTTIINHRLQELEKELFCDDDDDDTNSDAVSVVTGHGQEWTDTIQHLIAPSPTSSSSSSTSSPRISSKQSITEAATAISDGKSETASEILTRLERLLEVKGSSEKSLVANMCKALKTRLGKEYSYHKSNVDLLYETSPCFKLGFMAANLVFLELMMRESVEKRIHVVDFDVGQGGQYVNLVHALAAASGNAELKISAVVFGVVEDKLTVVGDGLRKLAEKVGVRLKFETVVIKEIRKLSRHSLGCDPEELLAVNLAFLLYKMPDESVTTENPRDELLRRVKGLSPAVVTVAEQEINTNTAPFVTRVNEVYSYYGAVFDSLEATVSRDSAERVRVEECLAGKMANSVAAEGRERVERCEVFGKWRARLGMAGFELQPLSSNVGESMRARLNSGTRGNPGFTVKEENGAICFGWMGRTLTVASAWR